MGKTSTRRRNGQKKEENVQHEEDQNDDDEDDADDDKDDDDDDDDDDDGGDDDDDCGGRGAVFERAWGPWSVVDGFGWALRGPRGDRVWPSKGSHGYLLGHSEGLSWAALIRR